MYSVVIPSVGRLEYLNELISSVLDQTLEPVEILVLLDDNEHCRSIESKIPRHPLVMVKLCATMNLAEKRNHGAAISRCDNIIFSDDDDLWAKNRAELVMQALTNHVACCHNFGKFGALTANSCSKLGCRDFTIEPAMLLYGANVFGGGSTIAANRHLVRIFPFSGRYRFCEDFEWWSRIILSGVKVRYLGDNLVYYRTHSTNMTRSVLKISHYSAMLAAQTWAKGAFMMLVSFSIGIRAAARIPANWLRG